ncbi:MAG: M48 family metalloprotease, partial [Armatimonadota bacterium]
MALTALAVMGILSLLLVVGCDEDDVEKSLGSQTARAVEQQYDLSTDPLLNEWVSNMGHMMVAHSNRQQIPYEFKVIDTDQVNAFAAPYGHIYFLRGLLELSESEDEVWFVAGHEITHIVKRDSIKSVKKNILYGLGAALVGGKDETMGDIVGLGAGLLLLHYSRDDERDADDGGCDLCYKAGYDPHGAIGFFDKLEELNKRGRPSSLEHLLLTHPPTPDRRARQLARDYFDGDNAEAQMHIARGYERRHQYGHAAKLFNTALDTAPDNTTARLGLADCYSAVGKLDEAREQYQSVLQKNSRNPYAARRLAALPDQPGELSQVPAVEQQQARV